MANNDAKIVLSATDKTAAAFASVNEALSRLEKQSGKVGDILKGAFTVAGIAAAARGFDSIIKKVDDLGDLAQKTGASIEKLSGLQEIAKIGGFDFDPVADSIVRLNKALNGTDDESKGAGAALAYFGLKAADLRNMDPADALKTVADAMYKVEDSGTKSAKATELLGKSGANALPYLNDLAEAQGILGKRTAEQQAQAEEYSKSLARLQVRYDNIATTVLMQAVPAVTALIKTLDDLLKQSAETGADTSMVSWADNTARALAVVADTAIGVVNTFKIVGRSIASSMVSIQNSVKLNELSFSGPLPNPVKMWQNKDQISALIAGNKEATTAAAEDIKGILSGKTFSDSLNEKLREARLANVVDRSATKRKGIRISAGGGGGGARGGDSSLWENLPSEVRAREEMIRLAKESDNELKDLADSAKEYYDSMEAITKPIEDQNRALADQIKYFGMTEGAINRAKAAELQMAADTAAANGAFSDHVDMLQSMADGYSKIAEQSDKLEGLQKAADMARDLGSALSNAFEKAIFQGGKFSDVLNDLLTQIAKMVIQSQIISPLEQALSGAIGNLFSGGNYAPVESITIGAAAAHGMAFGAGGNVIPFAKGGIVNSPTLFKFASGGSFRRGVMGEAGPESVMPLARTSSGDLGVRAVGGGGGGVSIVVNNNAGDVARASATASTSEDGQQQITIMVERVEGIMGKRIAQGGGLAPVMERRYGLNAAAGARR